MDKEEIVEQARRIGTLAISNIPDQDCCQLFTPKHPLTRARLEDVVAAEQALPTDDMIEAAVSAAVVETFGFPSQRRQLTVES
jgi:thiamine biosynthesis protein ThiI